MVNSKLLKAEMVLHGDTNKSLAEVLNISRQTIGLKINNKLDFWQSEIKIIVERYELTPEKTNKIFFN